MRRLVTILRKAEAAFLGLLVLAAPVRAAAPNAAAAARPRVIVVGWDGADWKLLDPLVAQGKLPNLAALLAHGRSWDLATYEPMASPLIWTTLATGRTPVDHGVADFQEFDPKTRVKVPISSRSRKVPAIWNAASARGVSVGVVGWWATWPAERVKGFLVSDRAAPLLFDADTLSRSPALAFPEPLGDGLRLLARREEVPYEDVAKALDVTRTEFDAAVRAGKGLEDPITGYRKILGSTRVYARTALELSEREKPELLMVYLQGTDEIGHLLARFHPPKMAGVSDQDFRRYSRGVVAFYEEADRLLGECRKAAERSGATLLLVSDHGFKWGESRPTGHSSLQIATAYLWHESPGILAAEGPAVAPAKARGKATVFDVVPTLCRILGLPMDPAFEGKPVAGLRAARLPAAPKPVSWASFPVERLAAGDGAADRKAADEFGKKLVSLGYLTGAEASAVDTRPPDRAGMETAESLQNVATFLRVRGKAAESIAYYRRALEVSPTGSKIWFNLAQALLATGKWDEADDALVAALRNGYYDPEAAIARHAAVYEKKGDKARLAAFLKKATAAAPNDERAKVALGKALFETQDCAGASRVFSELAAKRPRDTNLLNMAALTALCLGDMAQAKDLFARSLAVDPKQPPIQKALADLSHGGTAR
jgi:Flp pilus assembly protein TadD